MNLGGKERVLKMIQVLDVMQLPPPRKHCVHQMMMDDRRLVINQIANAISISNERVENILNKEHDMTNISILLVLRFLADHQKRKCLVISRENPTFF